ncbi:MAG: hypothetical protein MJK12_04070 [Colwellia sp.]|nr:hypothetical protein [Colwellia sp.]
MKILKLALVLVLSLAALSCSVQPIKTEVKENYFRFENFKRDKTSNLEYVYLMCRYKKVTGWGEPKQYLSGEHDLWVKASTSRSDILKSRKEAFVNFKVNLDSGKSYMLNRKIVEDKVSIWIQEVDTGLRVSKVLTSELTSPLLFDDFLRKRQCESGSI